jgi:hypothetical protein
MVRMLYGQGLCVCAYSPTEEGHAVTSRRTPRRARQRALDALEADPVSSAYDDSGESLAAATEGGPPVDYQAQDLDRQSRGGADPRARPRRSRPADRPGVRG